MKCPLCHPYMTVSQGFKTASTEVPDETIGHPRQRMVPQWFKYSSQSAMEDYLENHYWAKVRFTFFVPRNYTQDSRERISPQSYQVLTSSHWKGMTNERVSLSVSDVCQFYDVEEENVVTELKVFHSSYALSSSNVKAVLRCLKDNEVESGYADYASQNMCYNPNDNYFSSYKC